MKNLFQLIVGKIFVLLVVSDGVCYTVRAAHFSNQKLKFYEINCQIFQLKFILCDRSPTNFRCKSHVIFFLCEHVICRMNIQISALVKRIQEPSPNLDFKQERFIHMSQNYNFSDS